MSTQDAAIELATAPAMVTVPEAQLRPTTRGQEAAASLALYLAIVLPTMIIGHLSGMVAVVAFVTVWSFRRRRQWYRANTRLREVREALAADDVERAPRVCRELLVEIPRRSLGHAIAVGSWGVVELRRGRPREAIVMLERMLATGRFEGRVGTLLEVGTTTGTLALAHAIVGELDAARRMLAKARAQLGRGREDMLFTIECYLACREDRWAEVLERFDTRWREAEPKLTVGYARVARLLEALALEHLGGDEYRRSPERFERALDRAREARRGVYDYLVVQWPEGRDFLQRHALD